MYRHHTVCRACNSDKSLVDVLDLGLQPLANDFKRAEEEHCGYAPLKVMWCTKCGLAQLSVVVNPSVLYSNYPYVTSHSRTMFKHFEKLREDILGEATMANSVLEVGSNDGTLLAFLKDNPFTTVLGCDPAENLCKKANDRGVPTFCGLFTPDNCDCKKAKDVVIARHVMCHIDNWKEFVKALDMVTHDESLVVIEVPYYKDMINARSWDQVYHEHLSYMSIGAMQALLKESPFWINKVQHYAIHGGAIVMFLRKVGSKRMNTEGVDDWIVDELNSRQEWEGLQFCMRDMVEDLTNLVDKLRKDGKRVVGYGASAKSTVWINRCGFGPKDLDYVVDCTLEKQYRLSPGTNIPIVPDGMLTADMPDYAICFAWNFFSPEIYEKEGLFRKNGGKWILPVPSVKVID